MRIDSIEIFHVAMPLISPRRTAYGEDATIESVLVRMQGAGHVGWGEASPLAAPCYSPEWAGGVFACVRDWLAPGLVGESIESGDDLQRRLAHFKGNPFAKSALDTAWWVLKANVAGKPLHRLLGATRDAVDVGADFGVQDSIGELIEKIRPAVDAGFKRVKLKYRPGWDVRMLEAVRREFPTQTFHIDCNSGYTLSDFEMFCRLDDFNLAMIEQPLAYDDLIDHARLQQAIRTPVCLDESINSLARTEQALDLQSCRWVNIKPGRVGGLTVAVKIHDLCRAAGVGCWVGGMLEIAVVVRICTALAMLDNFTYPAEYSFLRPHTTAATWPRPRWPWRPVPTAARRCAALDAPGIGCEPDAEMLEKLCVARAVIRPKT